MKILNTGTHYSKIYQKTFITFQQDSSVTHFPHWRTWQSGRKPSTSLCKFFLNSQTLQHVVSACKVYLHEGRYNWWFNIKKLSNIP